MHILVSDLNSAQNLMNGMKTGNWIILYYANWCGHCQTFKPEWERLKTMMPAHINTAEAESEIIPQMPFQPQIQGYPTMKLYSNNKDIGDYNGEHSSNAILNHLKKVMSANKVTKSKNSTSTRMSIHGIHSHHRSKRHHRSHRSHRSHRHLKTQLATKDVFDEMKLESKRLKSLLSRTKVLNPARMHTPTQAVKYLEGSLRKNVKKTIRRKKVNTTTK